MFLKLGVCMELDKPYLRLVIFWERGKKAIFSRLIKFPQTTMNKTTF